MSDIDSMVAARATSCSPISGSSASPEPSQDDPAFHFRNPSPAGRSQKRRRLDSSLYENHKFSKHFNHDDVFNLPSSPILPSNSAPDLPNPLDGARPFEPQPRTFLGHDREFISYILSSRGVFHRARAITRHRPHVSGLIFGIENVPVISMDNSSFVGWREKADTWPMVKGHYIERSSTFPQ